MNKRQEWNRREFIVKPIVWAGAATVLGQTDLLLASLVNPTANGPVLQRTLGKTGITLPIVSMGVMNADVPGLLRRAYEVGIRHFDTAAGYQKGRNEEMVGQVIKELGVRDKVTISTKQASRNRPQNGAEAKKRFIEGVESSLRRLQMDHVDILYHHAVDSVEDARADGPLEALQSLKKDGKTRFVALSTHKTQDVINEAVRLNLFDVALVTLNYTMAHDAGVLSTIERAAKRNRNRGHEDTGGRHPQAGREGAEAVAGGQPNGSAEVGAEPRFHYDSDPGLQHLRTSRTGLLRGTELDLHRRGRTVSGG